MEVAPSKMYFSSRAIGDHLGLCLDIVIGIPDLDLNTKEHFDGAK